MAANFFGNLGDVPVGRGSPDADVVAAKNGGAVTLGMAVVALCMMVMVVIYFTGTVAGASQSRGSFRLRLTTNFPWPRVPDYILGRIEVGIAAAIFVAILGRSANSAPRSPARAPCRHLLTEVLLTDGGIGADVARYSSRGSHRLPFNPSSDASMLIRRSSEAPRLRGSYRRLLPPDGRKF